MIIDLQFDPQSNIKLVLFLPPLAPHLSWADMILVSVLPSEISVIAQAGVHEYPIFGSMFFFSLLSGLLSHANFPPTPFYKRTCTSDGVLTFTFKKKVSSSNL